MKPETVKKYRPYPQVGLDGRTWPDKTMTHSPVWCSVDLRDGNQALVQPMSLGKKLEMFELLVGVGFKEIEVGFPSASQVEYNFTRTLIEKNLIGDDVLIQVLTQAREHLIKKTFASLKGAKEAIVHMYNSTSTLQRRAVFKMSKQEIRALAVNGAKLILEEADRYPETKFRYEYSPESFTGTEMDFALEICEAVMDVWEPTPENRVIINLPATVEMSTPNVYADQIEWFCNSMNNRDRAIISLHAHNDRGSAVAATELAMLAGGDRVEGTLFGNGERTGNVDIVTLALNLFTQGVDPKLDLHDINRLIDVYERVTKMDVHVRHPYAGELVYTAFSGSHQDAINKGIRMYEESESGLWEVPYLPIDPGDVGRTYESIIRITSQSGKGGIAFIMEEEFGFKLPKSMQPEFGMIVQELTDEKEEEAAKNPEKEWRGLRPEEIKKIFKQEYLSVHAPYELVDFRVIKRHIDPTEDLSTAQIEAEIKKEGQLITIAGDGNGPVNAFCSALQDGATDPFKLCSYYEHALNKSSSAKAVAYIELEINGKRRIWGAGIDTDIIVASIKAVLSCLNRAAIQR